MCCQAQAIDQQPLKAAQFYAIPWKSEGVSTIEYAALARAPTASARLKPVGFHYRNSGNPDLLYGYFTSICFY